MNSNILFRFISWIGDVFEQASPAIFKVIVAVLPYISPIPVAAYTARSAATSLQFTPQVSFTFVLVLEGIGIWVTTALVESIVDWVRSRNSKTAVFVGVFALVTSVYVYILVTLNVTLHANLPETSLLDQQALQRVVTLICFLPLISGICNGMYKVRLQGITENKKSQLRQQELEDEARRLENERKALEQTQTFQIENEKLRLQAEAEKTRQLAEIEREKIRVEGELKMAKLEVKRQKASENNALPSQPEEAVASASTARKPSTPKPSTSTGGSVGNQVYLKVDEVYGKEKRVLTHRELCDLGFDKSTAFRHRNRWLSDHPSVKA
jgi:hypothetical protein